MQDFRKFAVLFLEILRYEIRLLTLFRGGGGGDGKFAQPSADLIFRIEEKFFTASLFLLLIFFSYAIFVKTWVQMVENYGQGETFVKGD